MQQTDGHDELMSTHYVTASVSTLWCRLLALLIVVTVLLYGHRITLSHGDFSDAPHHIINGIFLLDALQSRSEAMADPIGYAMEYYSHYPAVNIGYYPPVFYVCEAMVMAVCGISSVSAQITVLLFAVLLTYFTFNWLLIRLPIWWAAAGTVLIISTPYLVYWGQDITIEVPVLAFVTDAMWLFDILLQSKKPRWLVSLGWAALTALAIWTKQHALMLLPVYAISMVTTKQWAKLKHPAILVSILIIVAASVGQVFVMLKFIGGDAVGHSIGFTKQHVFDRFNLAQWAYYIDRLTHIFSWSVIILFAVGIAVVLLRRVRQGSVLLVWIISFYLMHSYMKAQSTRYACMVIPPICLLATLGIKHALTLVGSTPMGQYRKSISGAAIMLLVGYQLYDAFQVRVPHQATVYRQVADDLSAQMGPFACLSFAPQEPSRMAVLYRLSIESHRNVTPDVFAYGSILRAEQLLRNWKSRGEDAAALSKSLKEWNVKYILIEWPTYMVDQRQDMEIKQAIDDVIALNEFTLMRQYPVDLSASRYPVRLSSFDVSQRTLYLYERIETMTFNPEAAPPLYPKRVNFTIKRKVKLSN